MRAGARALQRPPGWASYGGIEGCVCWRAVVAGGLACEAVGPALASVVAPLLGGEAFGFVAEEQAVDESLDEFSVLVWEACGGF
ncbi:MAG: hypothetical protein JWN10_812 [Solirubrobacterales bacterium]|nr:hypothetical protein [Solirubrobacterales bacterium]